MHTARRDVILNIISRQNIETQRQLMKALEDRGIICAQATLSRDIKELNLVKERGEDGVRRYTAAKHFIGRHLDAKMREIFNESVESFDYAQNILVVKTLPGLAPAAGSAIDNWHLDNIVGTLAGNDTVFLAMTDSESAKNLYDEWKDIIKE